MSIFSYKITTLRPKKAPFFGYYNGISKLDLVGPPSQGKPLLRRGVNGILGSLRWWNLDKCLVQDLTPATRFEIKSESLPTGKKVVEC